MVSTLIDLPDLSPFPLHAISLLFEHGLFLGIHSSGRKIISAH